jgi:hypothetical protein
MSKVNVEEVESVLLQKKIPADKVQDIVNDLNKIVEELKEEREANKGKKVPWETTIVLLDKDGTLANKELAGFVVQSEEGVDQGTLLAKISDAAKNQNETAKRKRNFITTLTQAFEWVKPKFLKEKKVKIRTKELSHVIVATDKLV